MFALNKSIGVIPEVFADGNRLYFIRLREHVGRENGNALIGERREGKGCGRFGNQRTLDMMQLLELELASPMNDNAGCSSPPLGAAARL